MQTHTLHRFLADNGTFLLSNMIYFCCMAVLCVLPVSFGCFEWRSFKPHWAEVVVLAVVDVSHGLIL